MAGNLIEYKFSSSATWMFSYASKNKMWNENIWIFAEPFKVFRKWHNKYRTGLWKLIGKWVFVFTEWQKIETNSLNVFVLVSNPMLLNCIWTISASPICLMRQFFLLNFRMRFVSFRLVQFVLWAHFTFSSHFHQLHKRISIWYSLFKFERTRCVWSGCFTKIWNG